MEDFSVRHRRFVANYFAGKVKELHFQLAIVINGCDQSLKIFTRGDEISRGNNRAVLYGFSAFTNVIQTLKDSVKTVTNEQLDWSKISLLRHGSFMHNVRNAATHDGNPVINGWADGRYFIATKIIRLDARNKIVEVPAPIEDVRAICLEFAKDFCHLLRETLLAAEIVDDLKESMFDIAAVEEAFANSTLIPDFARELLANTRDELKNSLKEIKYDPIADAIRELDVAIQYCDSVTALSPASDFENSVD
ncbi:hypothetical protein ALP86_103165 [Pseudomonas amygdali pv. mori]|uniref:Uncharacterized protein n=1 Tax=Pseudomonas amygdali pv. mori TaxID=34065 RepID=A0A3M5JI21_PSEA0|nr:hypothetical protein [Pseudomonas amygdali]RMQ31132.1 hypothetical protein ALQ05_102421 [Pseudomonas amygdali pv. mori]RMR41162.1 hypothetical protein ALP86_103165 [Pseudomonas amygdali pv. mori]RMT22612.1 hypothetical protein ALP52_03616 [Pseudomonas amygdali pv. mori]